MRTKSAKNDQTYKRPTEAKHRTSFQQLNQEIMPDNNEQTKNQTSQPVKQDKQNQTD